jgi:hypothetical protein
MDGNGDGIAVSDIGSFEFALSPTQVTITGPDEGVVDQSYTFIATVEPISTTQPLTFLWQASGQVPVTHTGGITDTVAFTWALPGTQLITVTASNGAGSVKVSTVVNVMQPEKRIYLPVTFRSASPSTEAIYWRRQE